MFRRTARIIAAVALVAAAAPPASASAAGNSVKQIAAGGQDSPGMLDAGRVRVSSSSGVSATP